MWHKRMNYFGRLALLALLLSGCNHSPANVAFEREMSVNSLLMAKQPLQVVHVFYSTDRVADIVNQDDVFAGDAEVTVTGNAQSVRFHLNFDSRGRRQFTDAPETLRVISGETYRLTVRGESGVINGETVVPGAFQINNPASGDTLLKDQPFTFRWTASEAAKGYLIYIYRPPVEIPITPDSTLIARPQEMFGATDTEIEIPGYVFREPGKHLLFVVAYDENFYQHTYQEHNASGITGGYGMFASAAVDTLHFFVSE